MNLKISKRWSRNKLIVGNLYKINAIVFPEFRNFFATGSTDSLIRLWDKTSFKQISILKGQKGSIKKIIIDKKTGSLISGGEDMNIFAWDIEYGKILRIFRGHRSGVNCLSNHSSLNLLVSGSRDNTIRIWDMRMKKEALLIKHHKNQITSVIFNNESPHLISSSKDSRICLWDIIAFKCTNCLLLHPSGIKETRVHSTELKFASSCSYLLNFWRIDGFLIKKINIFKNITLFTFKNNNEFVTVDYTGWMNFYKWKNFSFPFNPSYGFFPFNQGRGCTPTVIEFSLNSSTFLASNKIGEMGIFRNKWSM